MQLISLGTQYVVTALIILGKHPVGEAVPASELAKPMNSPATYLSQMLSKLITSGIIGTRRGIKGGVYLEKDPSDIRLIDIIREIDGNSFFNSCFLGIKGCGEIEPCPFHDEWGPKRDKILNWLEQTTLEDLCASSSEDWIDQRMIFTHRLYS